MDSQDHFYDIYDFYYVSFWQTNFFKIILFLIIFFILAFIFFKIFLKKKRKMLTAWQWAVQELEKLSVDKFVTKKDYKKFYFDLTSIIKIYLQKRYGWATQDKTDEELIEYLQKKNFDETLLKDLQQMLSGALWIKFANEDVLKTQSIKDLKLAFNLVGKTVSSEK